MFTKNGIDMYEPNDKVKIGKRGTVTYKVTLTGTLGALVEIEHPTTGRRQDVAAHRLVLVENSRPAEEGEDGGSETGGNKPSYQEIKDAITVEEIRQNTRTQKGISKARKTNREERGSYSKLILAAIQALPVVYMGTVSDKVKSRRRAKNKLARASRKANR